MFYVYVIRNENNKIYIGQTDNIEIRLKRHNQILKNKISSFTSINKGKWVLVYKEEFVTRLEAIKREKYLKSHIGRDWLRKEISGP